ITRPRYKKEFYAVTDSPYLDIPTIFSSWGSVRFPTLEEAKQYMRKKGIESFNECIQEGAGNTTPILGQELYFTVVNRKSIFAEICKQKIRSELDRGVRPIDIRIAQKPILTLLNK
ncbi:uncharacterized protein K452DRAFT_291296, partial [Aplosporella prunicola CBS 121167]